jgi:hypothetical protein
MNKYYSSRMGLSAFLNAHTRKGHRVIVTAGPGAPGCNLEIEVVDPRRERAERAAHQGGDAAPYPYGVVVRARHMIGCDVEILDNAAPDFDV